MKLHIALFLLLVPYATAQHPTENDYYTVDYLTPPGGVRVEVGGMDFLPDGRLVVSTRRGQVWLVENALAQNPADAVFHLFAEGFHEGLGLNIVDGEIFVLQRTELSRLRDVDGDGRCDHVDVICNDWGASGNYHEFAFGLPRDAAGNFFMSLNVSFANPWWHGRSPVPYRGWVLRISPDGTLTPWASGFRSPCGLGLNDAGDLFATDNQGDWMAACPIFHVKRDRFYGHPASLDWSKEYQQTGRKSTDTDAPERTREQAAIWLPYSWSRSTGNLAWDSTEGRFGPFGKQLFVAEITNGQVLRAQLEKVGGEYQGAVFRFRQHVGSVNRVLFAPDGTLFAGMTNRGWGGQSPPDGVARIRPTKRKPMEIQEVHLRNDGFDVTFTQPVNRTLKVGPQYVRMQQYDYNYWWEYGSPEQHTTKVEVTGASLSDDRRTMTILAPALRQGMVARVRLILLRSQSNEPLLHNEFNYTINRFPDGHGGQELVSKLVDQPLARENSSEGWLYLSRGENPLGGWRTKDGWRSGTVELDTKNRRLLAVKDGKEELVNAAGGVPSDLVTLMEHQDVEAHVKFFLPEGGNSGVYLMGRYEIQISDSGGTPELRMFDCGGIIEGEDDSDWPGRAPDFNAWRGPGNWHDMDIIFRAPRFHEGTKVENARILRVRVNDVLLHENVEIPAPSRGAISSVEMPRGPLVLQGGRSPVAFRDVWFKAHDRKIDREGWTRIFNGRDIGGWKVSDGGTWEVRDGVLIGTGARSHIFSPRGDYKNLEFRARVRINDKGNSGMYFRTRFGPGWPEGYEAQVNSTFQDPVKSGSLYGLANIETELIPADVWFDQHIICRDVPEGTRVTIMLNGITVTDYVDTERRHSVGHVAFQQHHQGSVVEYKDIEVRELK